MNGSSKNNLGCHLPASSNESGDDTNALGLSLDRIVLAAPLLLSVLLIVLNDATCCRIPLRQVIPWAYPPTLVLGAVCLLTALRFHSRLGPFVCTIALASLAVYLSMAAFFGTWLPAPVHTICMGFDDWCYQALGDYLWNNPRGRVAGMSMIDEFGAHLQDTRFSAPCLLEFIGSTVPFKDPAVSHFTLGTVCLSVHFISMFYLGRALLAPFVAVCAGAFLATAGGWMSEVLELGNYDNLIFLALIPAFIGVLVHLAASARVSWWLIAAGGILLAAVLETFPEGVPLLLVMLIPFVIFLLYRGMRRPGLLLPYVALLVLGLALASPYLPIFRTFFLHQIQSAQDATKMAVPRNFPGLVNSHRLPASFALGEEVVGASFTVWNNALPLILLALLGIGAWTWRRTHSWFPWVSVALGSLLFWQNVFNKYDYGTYKVLVCAGWWIYLSVVAGIVAVVRRMGLPDWSVAFFLVVLSAMIGWEKYEHRTARPAVYTNLMGPLRELTNLRFITQQEPLLLDLEDFNYTWATYYLRRLPITTFKQRGTLSMPHLAPYLTQGTMPPPTSARFVLVEGRRADALWTNDSFSLLPLTGAYIGSVNGPIAGEGSPGILNYVWVGSQPETFRVRSTTIGQFDLRVSLMEIGPRAPRSDEVAFEVTDSTGPHQYNWKPGDPQHFPVHLDVGENFLLIRCTEIPSPAPEDGDPREVMLQLRGYSLAPGA